MSHGFVKIEYRIREAYRDGRLFFEVQRRFPCDNGPFTPVKRYKHGISTIVSFHTLEEAQEFCRAEERKRTKMWEENRRLDAIPEKFHPVNLYEAVE